MNAVLDDRTPTNRPTLAQIAARLAWLQQPLLAFATSRLLVVAAIVIGHALLPTSPHAYHLRGDDNLLVDALGSRWDTGFYVSIAENGYEPSAEPFPNTPFFPLLPLLMRLGGTIFGDVVVAGILISNVALLTAAVLFYRLVLLTWPKAVADRAVWYLLLFPTALFGSAIYSESLFLLTTIGALYFARRRRWWLALLCGVLATTTRLVGVIVAPMLLLEALHQSTRAKPAWRGLAAALLAPTGLLTFSAYLWRQFGDPLAFVHGSAAWGRVAQRPAVTLARMLQAPPEGWLDALRAGRINVNDWLDLAFLLFFLLLAIALMLDHRWSEGAFVWLGVMIAFSSGLLISQRRYVWVLFPAIILLARYGERPWVDKLITTLSVGLLALFSALFAAGYWVA